MWSEGRCGVREGVEFGKVWSEGRCGIGEGVEGRECGKFLE